MPLADAGVMDRGREELARIFSEVEVEAAANHWEAAAAAASAYERLLRCLLAAPENVTTAYLEELRAEHQRLLARVVTEREHLRDEIRLLATGRKAVAAYG